MGRPLRDRTHAGQLLAKKLSRFAGAADTIVMALPRGGVVVGAAIAEALRLPLDACVVRKLGVPWQPELAMGAVAAGGVEVLNRDIIASAGVRMQDIDRVVNTERKELDRRERAYRGQRPFPDLHRKTVLVADDGIATGATMEVALKALRLKGAKKLVVAAGVAPPSVVERLSREADEVVCALQPEHLYAIGQWFDEFQQVTDGEVQALLARFGPEHQAAA